MFHISLYEQIGTPNYVENGTSLTMIYPCDGSTQCTPYVVTLNPGLYFLQCWGAQGGGKNTGHFTVGHDGGKGGYSEGYLLVNNSMDLFVYIGGTGISGFGDGGFNGGGAVTSSSSLYNTGPGGGATDMRTIPGEKITRMSVSYKTEYYGPSSSLDSRIIVAGGGGSGRNYPEVPGWGGGLSGGETLYSSPGTQNNPGKAKSNDFSTAGYGYGSHSTAGSYAGGGGGYYGGGSFDAGSGGSGYVSSSLSQAQTIPGNTSFPSPLGGFQIGHSGHGAARVTLIYSLSDIVGHLCPTYPIYCAMKISYVLFFISLLPVIYDS